MIRRRWRLLTILGGLLLVAAGFKFSPLWPGPALPDGATRLHIATAPAHLIPTLGCTLALLGPARIATNGDQLVLLSAQSNDPIDVVWPSGWAAWRLAGRAELVTRDGAIVGREGDVVEGFYGGTGADDMFHVCIPGS